MEEARRGRERGRDGLFRDDEPFSTNYKFPKSAHRRPRAAMAGVRAAFAFASAASKPWHVYIVETKSGKLYSGITVDVRRRIEQHCGKRAGGAKALRGDPPVRLRYAETARDRSSATRREMAIKRLPRAEKLRLIDGLAGPADDETDPERARVVLPEELAGLDPLRECRREPDSTR